MHFGKCSSRQRPHRTGFGRLKRFKRVALRCEKTARNFRSIVSFAAGLCLIKFVHTA
jgi:transposase